MDCARGKGEMRLALWFVNLKQANGKDYEHNCLDSYLSASKATWPSWDMM